MSYRTKLLLTSAASAVAPDPFYGRLSEPLLAKKRDDEDVGDEHEKKEEEDPWSSIGVVVGAIVLGVAG
jgi:hypothetical protein